MNDAKNEQCAWVQSALKKRFRSDNDFESIKYEQEAMTIPLVTLFKNAIANPEALENRYIPVTVLERLLYYSGMLDGAHTNYKAASSFFNQAYGALIRMFETYHMLLQVYVETSYTKLSDYDFYVILC